MKKALIVLTLLAGFAVQAMGPPQDQIPFKTSDDQIVYLDSRVAQQSGTLANLLNDEGAQRGEPLQITVQTNDGTTFVVEKSIIAQSGVLSKNVQDHPDNYEPIVLPNLDAKSLECLVDLLKEKISLADLSPEQMGAVYTTADYLDVPAIMEQFSEIDFFLSRKFYGCNSVVFSPDGKHLATRGSIGRLISLPNGLVIKTFDKVNDLNFNADGSCLELIYTDKTTQLIQLHDLYDDEHFPKGNGNESLRIADRVKKRGKEIPYRIELGKDSLHHLIRRADEKEIMTLANATRCNLSPEGNYLAVEYADPANYNKRTGALISTDDGLTRKSFRGLPWFGGLEFTPDGKHLFIRYQDQYCTGQLVRLNSLQDYLPAEAALIIKAFAASKQDEKFTLSQEEYETYLSLDEQAQRTLEEYFIILWHVRALKWIKTHPKTAVGLAAGGFAVAGGLYYWLKNTN